MRSATCLRCDEEQKDEKCKEASKNEEKGTRKDTAARLRERRTKQAIKQRENRLHASSLTSAGLEMDAEPKSDNDKTKDVFVHSENSSGW